MCVVKSTRPRRKVHACARFANTQFFFVSSIDSTHHLTTMDQEKKQRESIDDYEEAQSFLKQEEDQDNLDLDRFPPPPTMIASSSSFSSKGLSNRFWISACVNTASTAAIVRTPQTPPKKNNPPKHLSHTTPTPQSRSSSTNASSKPPPSDTPK